MRFLIAALLCAAVGTAAVAQRTIDQHDFMLINPAQQQLSVSGVVLHPGPAGANVTWDFSGIGNHPMDTFPRVVTPPADGFQDTVFDPLSNYALTEDSAGSVYFDKTATRCDMVGYATVGGWVVFDDPERTMEFPMNVGDDFSDTYRYELEYPGIGALDISDANKTMTYDGYGTLILPSGSYADAVRFKTVEISRDSSFFNGVFQGADSDTTEWFHWLIPGNGYWTVLIKYNINNGDTTQPYYDFAMNPAQDTSAESVADLTANEINTWYRNGRIAVAANRQQSVWVSVTDMSGRQVLAPTLVRGGMGAVAANGLAQGCYIVTVSDATSRVSRKIWVAN